MPHTMSPGEHVGAIDIGGTNIVAVVLDHAFKVVSRRKIKSRSKKDDEPTEDRVIRAMRDALDEADIGKVVGIGIGSPGPLDPFEGIVIETPNLAWKNFPLAKVVSDAFDVPAALDNDVNLGTLGEWRFGDVSQCNNVIGIFPGTGVGGGWVFDGKLFYGASGSAFEIGHMTLEVDGPFCGCGKRGCLEALTSRIAIAEQIAALAARHDAPYIYERCGADIAQIRSGIIAEAIAAGEKMVEAVVRKAAYYTGIGAANLINVVSPQAVVLGGGLVEAMGPLYMEEVSRAIKEHAMSFVAKDVRLMTARLGDDAVVMGAAVLILDRMEAAA